MRTPIRGRRRAQGSKTCCHSNPLISIPIGRGSVLHSTQQISSHTELIRLAHLQIWSGTESCMYARSRLPSPHFLFFHALLLFRSWHSAIWKSCFFKENSYFSTLPVNFSFNAWHFEGWNHSVPIEQTQSQWNSRDFLYSSYILEWHHECLST